MSILCEEKGFEIAEANANQMFVCKLADGQGTGPWDGLNMKHLADVICE